MTSVFNRQLIRVYPFAGKYRIDGYSKQSFETEQAAIAYAYVALGARSVLTDSPIDDIFSETNHIELNH